MTAAADPTTKTTTAPDVDLETLWHAEIPCVWGAPDRLPQRQHQAATWMITVYPCAIQHSRGPEPIREEICQLCVDQLERDAAAMRGAKSICFACAQLITVPDDYYSLRKL